MEKPLRVGIIGSGKFAGHHSKVWQSINGVELIGCFGRDTERSRVIGYKQGIKSYDNIKQLIQNCDLIDVVSMNNMHGDYALEAISAGCHVIIEKPIDIEVGKAREVCTAARERGVVASVVSPFRFNPCFQEMKQVIEMGGIGEVLGGQVTVLSPRSEAYYSKNGGWRADPGRVGGGVLIHQCIHHIDLLHWLLGDIDYVCGVSSNWTGGNPGRGVECTFSGLLQFASRVPVEIFLTTKGQVEQQRIEIFGSRAVASSNGQFFSTARLPSPRRIIEIAATRFGLLPRTENTSAQLKRQFMEVIATISKKSCLSVSLENGLRALETVCELYQTDRQRWRPSGS